MDRKYSSEYHTEHSWDFLKGHKQAFKPKTRPNDPSQPAEITLNGRLPFVILVPEMQEDLDRLFTMVILEDQIGCEISFNKVVVQENQGPLMMAIEDINGEFSYSNFSMRIISCNPINYPLDNIIRMDGDFSPESIFELAVTLLKKFILCYKATWHLERFKYPSELRKSLLKGWIPEFDYRRLSPWTNMSVISMTGEILFSRDFTDYRGTGVALGTDLTDDTLSILQQYCAGKVEPTLQSYMDIANRHFINHEYEAFCIFLACIIEKEIFEYLVKVLTKRGKTESEINKVIKHSTRKRKDGSAQNINRDEALRLIFNGKEFENSFEYNRVLANIISKRDEIIHGGLVKISRQEAELMGSCFEEFSRYLLEVVDKQ